jgi:hypothetical protein
MYYSATNHAVLVEQYRYDAFGTPYIFNGSGTQLGASGIKNRFMFTGREYAPGTRPLASTSTAPELITLD